MRSHRVFLTGSVAIAALGLAGCGGSGSTSAIVDALFAEDVGTAAEALDDGKTLKAYDGKMSSTLHHEDVRRHDSAKVSIKKNDAGGIDVTVNGKTESYSSTHVSDDGYGFESDDGHRNIYTWSAPSAQDAVNGTGGYPYHQIWGYHWWDPESDDPGMFGFAVVGTETTSEVVAARTDKATYSGTAFIRSYGSDGSVHDRTDIKGDLSLTAEFDEGKISGLVNNVEGRERVNDVNGPWTAVTGGEIALQEADISGHGYEGKIAPNDTFNTALGVTEIDGTYRGKFFGPDAEETAGVISASGVADGEDFIATGSFSADED
ncbi:transferrin-binding protein-like solute binding protein [Chelativorans intermedius]|uniref:Transferrin-binding protein-like solute binding protein n=1 Tax=Chelativorans intermedius TaxID=515947 RepID=A0ABV6D3H0_9HYPH|nr:transferrin-binding protein-like solute binding protein [Chelativorans intermedius]MCT8998338.1 transferrin-binding protein-like solute binding protein [Chelativorans intermedius]